MTITKTKITIATALAVIAIQFAVQQKSTRELQREVEVLRIANRQIQNREPEITPKPRMPAELEALRGQEAELLQLRGEVSLLRRENQELTANKGRGSKSAASAPDSSAPNDPSARMELARTLSQERNYEAALEHLLWCFDEGAKNNPAFVGVRASFLLNQLAELGKSYPPAKEALKERRDAAEAKVRAGSVDPMLVLDVTALNKALDEGGKTLELFDNLPPGDTRRGILVKSAYDEFLRAGRYEEIFAAITPEAFFGDRVKGFTAVFQNPQIQENEALKNSMLDNLIGDGGRAMETLAGAGQTQRAIGLIDEVLQYDSSSETVEDLKRHARRAGNEEVLQYLERR